MHRLTTAMRGQTLHPIRRLARLAVLALACLGCGALVGCAAVTNPVADGIPVRRLPPEVLGKPRNLLVPISFTCLEPPPPDAYRLAPGDVLGVWIEGILGERGAVMPVTVSPPTASVQYQHRLPPVVGYPIPVRDDGTIALPMADPLRVQGMTLIEVQEAIRQLYTERRKILAVGNERILVSLLQPRTYQVLVFRQEATTFASGPTGIGLTTTSKIGTGTVVDLPAYENDVLHALAQTGGLPGQDAYDAVIVQHGCFRDAASREMLRQQFAAAGPHGLPPGVAGEKVVRIPLRVKPGDPVPIRPEDVTLKTGDVVFLELRDKEIFFTGGLLPSGEHVLPRDHDLDVVEAVARIRGPLINGAFANNNLSGNLILTGIGFDNPSLLTVVRRLPGGGVLPIRVDLNVALRDARERILVQPGDLLILQEKPNDALARYFGQTLLNFSLSWEALHDRFIQGVLDTQAPNQLSSNRIGVFQSTNINNP
jgi:hypothetical protein